MKHANINIKEFENAKQIVDESGNQVVVHVHKVVVHVHKTALIYRHLMNYEFDSIIRELAQFLQWNDSISTNNTSVGSLFVIGGEGW